MNKLGVSQFFAAIWRWIIPEQLRHRWHMYLKWTLGRKQVTAAQKLAKQMQQQIDTFKASGNTDIQ